MSGEQLATKYINKIPIVHSSKKVDINYLLAKVRQEENKMKKTNYIFLCLVCGVVAVTGIIVSF